MIRLVTQSLNMPAKIQKALLAPSLSDKVAKGKLLTYSQAEQVFSFFKACMLFKWEDVNNNCEGRAEAICMLLEDWQIASYKGWVMSGLLLRKGPGTLVNNWQYHVAALLPIQDDNEIVYYVVDPSTSNKLESLPDWANSVTDRPFSHYLIKRGIHYIFRAGNIKNNNWFKRNRQNYKWTIQGLSGINGLSSIGKAYLCFNKNKIKRTEKIFAALRKSKPAFLL